MDDAQLPPPDILTDYDLLQAYLKLADKMFPGQLRQHIQAFTYFDYSERLKEFDEKIPVFEKQISDAKIEIAEIETRLSKSTNESEIVSLTSRRDELYTVISSSNFEKSQFGERASMQAYVDGINRRKAVESRLVDAFKKGTVRYWLFPSYSTPHDSDQWKNEKGYGYDIELSVLRWPLKRYNLRRQSVRVYRKPFDLWLASEFPEYREPTLEEKALTYALSHMKATPNKIKQRDMIQHLREQFEGLTVRAAEEIWKQIPADLKIHGAPVKHDNK